MSKKPKDNLSDALRENLMRRKQNVKAQKVEDNKSVEKKDKKIIEELQNT